MSRITFARRLCAAVATLSLAAVPAFAQATEAAPRYDVRAACSGLDEQLGKALHRTWLEEARYGEVKVQFVVTNGRVEAADAQGISAAVARKVRAAMHRVDCSQQTAGTQVYRFSVDFVNPDAPVDRGDTRTASVMRIRFNG